MTKRIKKDPNYERARHLDAPLAEQLAQFTGSIASGLPEVADAYENLVTNLNNAGTGAEAPQVGEPMPPFLLPDENGRLLCLEELVAAGPLVVSFNRGNWCPFCWLELAAIGDLLVDIRRNGGDVVSITPETVTYNRMLKKRLDVPFRFLTDIDNGYGLEIGIAMSIPPELKSLLIPLGIDLAVYQKNDAWFVPLPATFVIDRGGIVRLSYVNPDYRERYDPTPIPALIADLA